MSAVSNPVPIRFMIDSADRERVEPWLATGIFAGVTTNPTILQRSRRSIADIPDIYRWAGGDAGREVCFQVWGETAEQLYRAGMWIREVAPTATVKVPVTRAGVEAASRLRAHDVPILLTVLYSAKQMLLASALGARYVAPYYNRMLVNGRDALAEIGRMTDVVPQDGGGPLVLAASLKSARDVVALAGVGVRAFTCPLEVVEDLFRDDLTAGSVRDFEQAIVDMGDAPDLG